MGETSSFTSVFLVRCVSIVGLKVSNPVTAELEGGLSSTAVTDLAWLAGLDSSKILLSI